MKTIYFIVHNSKKMLHCPSSPHKLSLRIESELFPKYIDIKKDKKHQQEVALLLPASSGSSIKRCIQTKFLSFLRKSSDAAY